MKLWCAKVKKYITDSDFRFGVNVRLGLYNNMPDEKYLCKMYKIKMGKDLNLTTPKTFNEKLQWLKLYDRKPIYTTMVDKYAVKQYVADRIGEEYIIPTLGVWDRFDDIDFDALPNQFVLKCTHDSGGLAICRNKADFDVKAARKKINLSMKRNYYYSSREWPYKDVPRKIIAEKYMEDKKTNELRDYKFFCFDGIPQALFVATERQKKGEEVKFDFYDMDFKHIDVRQGHPNARIPPEKPETFEEMKRLAEKLSEGIPQLRVDFYEVNGKTYFGELTFSHFGGIVPFNPEEWDTTLGKWVKLPNGGGYAVISESCVMWVHETENPAISLLLESRMQRKGLTDYKFYCFNGEPRFLYVSESLTDHAHARISYLNLDWSFADYGRSDYTAYSELPHKPKNYEKMLEICRILSSNTIFLRVDLYEICNKIYFSELTFFPGSGFTGFVVPEHDREIGDMLNL